MIAHMVIKLLVPKVLDIIIQRFKLDKVLEYVEKPNNLDVKVEELEDKIIELERVAHEPKEFVNCDVCNNKIKEK
tara:strand:+ start:356 stop:580 length:225 start_codon:yes stop_codon:yes gene_type:complete